MSGDTEESLTESVLKEEPNTQSSDSDTGHGETVDVVSEFVGEGKKYATQEEALKALAKKAKHADEFIETLKSEKQQVLNELNETKGKVQTAQELLELMRNNESAEEHTGSANSEQAPTLTREDILKTMEGILQQRETVAKRKAQFEASMKTLTETFGSEQAARESIANFIKADPSNKVIVDTIGVSNPAKLAKLMREELGEPETFSPDRSSSVTTRFDKATQSMTWTKAKEIKRSNPAMYNSVKFQKKVQEAIMANPGFYTT